MLHFKPYGFPMQVSRVSCDKEIGNPKRGWHACNARATVEAESRVCAGMFLHYCEKHSKGISNARPLAEAEQPDLRAA